MRRARFDSPAFLSLFAGLAAASCRTTIPAQSVLTAAEARAAAREAADPALASDLAWIEGNDRAYAKERLDAALALAPADSALHLRRALLAELDLDRAKMLEHLLAAIERPSAATDAALAILLERFEDLAASRDRITRALDASGILGDRPGSARRVLIASMLARRIAALDRDGAARKAALQRGGWITELRAAGPLAPKAYISLERPHELEIAGPLRETTFRGIPAPVRTLRAVRPSFAPSAGDVEGLYVAETYVELAAPATVDLQAVLHGSTRIRIGGKQVLERITDQRAEPTYQRVRLMMQPGLHRISIAVLASSDTTIALSLLASDGRTVVARESPESAVPTGAAHLEILETESGPLAALPSSSGSELFGRVLAARLALLGEARDIETARSMIRPAAAMVSSSAQVLVTNALVRSAEGQPRSTAQSELRRALELDPTCAAFTMLLAETLRGDQPDKALDLADRAREGTPGAAEPDVLRFRVMRQRGWHAEAEESLDAALEKLETVELLSEGARYYRSLTRVAGAVELETRALKLAEPGPGGRMASAALLRGETKAAIEALRGASATAVRPESDLLRAAELELAHGDLPAASVFIEEALQHNPLDARAHRLLAEIHLQSGRMQDALQVLDRLRWIQGPDTALEILIARLEGRDPGQPARESWLAQQLELDARGLATAPPEPRWEKHKQVRLLDRHIDWIGQDGRALFTQHLITRLLNKEATDAAGEFSLDGDTIPLAVRTLKADGRIIEVDRHPGKADLSYSALAPGDSVERKVVQIEPPITAWGGYVRKFYFQDSAPNLRSELFVVVPRGTEVEWQAYNGAPQPNRHEDGATTVYWFRMDDVPAVTPEPGAVPFEEYVPFVCVSVGMNQEIALRANRTPISGLARTSFEVEQTARAIVEGVEGDRAKAEAVFRWVTKNVRGGDLVDPAIALATRRGDRTGLITALLRAAGLQAEIVLARPNGAPRLDPPYLEPQRFGTALIRVRLEGAFSWISADDRAPWMGKAPPEFRGGSYVLARGEPATPIAFQNADVERWTLKSRVVLQVDASGNASGHVKIDLPGAPGQVIREALGPLRREDLARSLQQWVAAFLPGSAVGEVEVTARDDALVPLGISVKVTVPEFMTEERGKLVTNRFFDEPIATRAVGAPMLEAFIHLATRETPLWVPEMSESMEARVTFPEGTAPPIEKPESFSRESEWGTVEQTFAWDAAAHRATLVRSFAFPAQRVSVEKFPAFRDLVQEIALRTRNRLAIPRAVLAHSP